MKIEHIGIATRELDEALGFGVTRSGLKSPI
jgi:hypothetical protein